MRIFFCFRDNRGDARRRYQARRPVSRFRAFLKFQHKSTLDFVRGINLIIQMIFNTQNSLMFQLTNNLGMKKREDLRSHFVNRCFF